MLHSEDHETAQPAKANQPHQIWLFISGKKFKRRFRPYIRRELVQPVFDDLALLRL
jgi:hypothetical protein